MWSLLLRPLLTRFIPVVMEVEYSNVAFKKVRAYLKAENLFCSANEKLSPLLKVAGVVEKLVTKEDVYKNRAKNTIMKMFIAWSC